MVFSCNIQTLSCNYGCWEIVFFKLTFGVTTDLTRGKDSVPICHISGAVLHDMSELCKTLLWNIYSSIYLFVKQKFRVVPKVYLFGARIDIRIF